MGTIRIKTLQRLSLLSPTMSAATAMRLVPIRHVPRALAILNGSNAPATVVAAPLGSYFGAIIG